ncbi:acyl-CoA-binding domain-containing protein 6 isoform X1 [Pezoporus wallicus]|uniref:acyl-CoA-binding domain-containing protein 6 isoform X1 n=1 Tax=Pezoporus wallicus TaxID=35540 RepID=UPI00254CA224|nr:acyl-CoA-binding domain-containing protein 6 isoform X1 [Pezoporus wallicus]XP_061307967.1 acyl-CoA-binding domain-containing protein 6 isoform X1 [Pezoporus flaviventris]
MASPPLAAAAAGSGVEASSGSEETGTVPPDRDLAALFEQAAERLPALLPTASKEQLLYLYARFKQVKFGTCNTPKPSFFDFEGKQKWEAWKALGDTSPHQAMQEYVATVKKLDPSWNPQMTEKRGKESKTAFGGPVVSSLYQEETIREEDKNIFDYCRENNIDYVTKAIQSKKVDVNAADEEGRALLHWACDRGHKELVTVLLQHAADVNSQDGEGQTALHYAAACEFLDIVELLLKSGANPTLRDQEGCLPEEVTDCKAITSALQQHTAGKT